MPLSTLDLIALGWFIAAWAGYAITLEFVPRRPRAASTPAMNRYREVWMRRMLDREMRMVDMQIMAALQNGTAFFASTSLIAIGGALTAAALDRRGAAPSWRRCRSASRRRACSWEMKAIGLAVIFVYAFFKFAWSYRLYNYVAILLGATPPPTKRTRRRLRRTRVRTAKLFDGRGPTLQPRPARVLLRARLSRLVHQPVCVHGDDGGGRRS